MNPAAVVIGTSFGGLHAMQTILPCLPQDYPLPVVVVQHLSADANGALAAHLGRCCSLPVKEADEKEPLRPGHVYLAPANYHLLIEEDRFFSLSVDERVHFARPSIDVTFETAALAYGPALVGVLLTGANRDGSQGLRSIHDRGGLTVVQDPSSAEAEAMPRAALSLFRPDHVFPLGQIGPFLAKLALDRLPNGTGPDPGMSLRD